MIKNIIFDIGNVLATFSWEKHIQKFGFSKEIAERVAKATVKSPIWNEYDRGVWTTKEIIDGFVKNDPGVEREIRLMNEDLTTIVEKREYAVPWVLQLKAAGYRVFYLSNFSSKAETECAHALTFIQEMDGGVFSYQEKLIKPDPAIYQVLLDRYDLVSEECVFMDDTEKNVEMAKKLGFASFVFTTKEEAVKELKQLGVNV